MSKHALVKVVLIAAIFSVSISADSHSESLEIWGGAGAGLCSLGFGSAHVSASIKYGWAIASFRRMGAKATILDAGSTMYESALMLGVVKRTTNSTVSFEAGIGWLGGHWKDDPMSHVWTEFDSVLNVALGSQIIIGPWKYVGLGVYPYLNINEYETYGGVHVTVSFGLLRN